MNKTVNKMMAIGVVVTMLLATGVSKTFAASTSVADPHNVVITVNEKALLALHSTQETTFTIDIVDTGTAGDPIAVTAKAHEADNYLHYTSIVNAKDKTRKITVYIDALANIPAGTKLTVLPGDPATTGQGGKGTAASTAIDLSTAATSASAKDLVTLIKSCSTGKAATDGVQLTYDLTLVGASIADLVSGTYTTVVTYTLTDSTF